MPLMFRPATPAGIFFVFVAFFASACGGGNPSSPTTVPSSGQTPATSSNAAPPANASYTVTFDATWSPATHPTDFPSNAHFSPLVGGTHVQGVRFWEPGGIATEGIQRMAEMGRTSPLDSEVNAAIANGGAQYLLLGGVIGLSPGSVSLDFQISRTHPFVTLVSMIAPSPDWFVGVSALPLLENEQWRDTVRVDLYPYDAGTDDGDTYAAPDRPAVIRAPIARLEGPPFTVAGTVAPLGTFTFRRRS